MKNSQIRNIFTDIGGVLLTNGWDHKSRQLAAQTFGFDYNEFEPRHMALFDGYERGKITLDDYLESALFYKKQNFTPDQFKKFMFSQSKLLLNMLALMKSFKQETKIRIFLLSNEGRELAEYRIKTFQLNDFADACIVSSFVQLKKPDPDIYNFALDLASCKPEEAVYIEDRALFVEIAEKIGIKGIHHTSPEKTIEILKTLV